jgi:hypothetical protein
MMTRLSLLVLLGVFGFNCSPCPASNPACNTGLGGNGGSGGGSGGGGALSRYSISTIDPAASDSTYLDIVVDPNQNRVGIAYLVGTSIQEDAGTVAPMFEVRYTEWKDGVVSTPEAVDHVQRYDGVAVDFHPTSGEPIVAYLGGGSDMSLYWFNSDAVYSTRNNGAWSMTTVATGGFASGITCGNPVSDNAAGLVIGLWPAIRYDSTGKIWMCARDVHSGQYPEADWAGSDTKCWSGSAGNFTGYCTEPGGNNKSGGGGGYGGRIRMVMINDKPWIAYDQIYGSSDGIGNNVNTQSWDGTKWSSDDVVLMTANTGTGPTIAYDSTVGYGMAVQDINTGVLTYVDKSMTATQWNSPDQVYGSGTGGLEPSLAFDPMYHEPAIAYFICSLNIGANADHCQPDHQELDIAQRIMGNWQVDKITTDHVTRLRLGFLPNGKRVVVFREYQGGAVKIAVEN